jgi:Ras-related GTP-binding protein C/D
MKPRTDPELTCDDFDCTLELLEDIHQRLIDELYDIPEFASSAPTVTFHLTSIYEPTVYEAFSRAIQKLMPCQAALERLLDSLCQVRFVYLAS